MSAMQTMGFLYTVFATGMFTAVLFWLAYHGLRAIAAKALRDVQSVAGPTYMASDNMGGVTVTTLDRGFQSVLLARVAK